VKDNAEASELVLEAVSLASTFPRPNRRRPLEML
jgi:hypothetical protein